MRALAGLLGGNLLLWVVGAAVAALLVVGTVQTLRLADMRSELASEKRDRAVERAQLEQAAREQSELNRATEHEWQAAQHEHAITASKARDQAALDAVAADAAAGRLRGRFDALAATCRAAPGDSRAIAAGHAASAPGDLLAELLGRMDTAARQIAAYADAAGISGEHCAADYQALRPSP